MMSICPSDLEPAYLRAMINSPVEQQTGGPLSRLKGRALVARLEDEPVAIVLLRHELDKSSFESVLVSRHVMVVEAVALTPALPPDTRQRERMLLDVGLQRALVELAQCHKQRIEFSYSIERDIAERDIEPSVSDEA